MPSAANGKSEKAASSEATDNSPIRQIMTIIEHKIRNLEKRKSKLNSYRDLQKAGKELHADQKVAVAKYDEVAQTLEFARDLSKQVMVIATATEREAKKQAKKEAWVKYAVETNKIREVLLIMDCLTQMGNTEARNDFLNGTNGAAKLTDEDLRILDDLYSEVTPKHELNEEGQPAFHANTSKAAEHLWGIIDGKPKEVIGTTYAHIKDIVNIVHSSAYFDRSGETQIEPEPAPVEEPVIINEPAVIPATESAPTPLPPPPAAPAPTVVPTPVYPLRPLPPITLQEVEHAYFSQQYGQQRPIAEVIGSQNFFFLQESEIDSPVGTPQPPMMAQGSPPAPIPTQTFTNQHFAPMPLPPQPHFPPHPDHAAYAPVAAGVPMPTPLPPHVAAQNVPAPISEAMTNEESQLPQPAENSVEEDWKEGESPERVEPTRVQGQGDGGRYRRGGRGRGAPNGYRGRGGYGARGDQYRDREYQPRSHKDGYQNRNHDGYTRHKDYRNSSDNYYGNGDANDNGQENGRESGGYKSRGRGGPRGGRGSAAPRTVRSQQYTRSKQDHVQ